MGNQSSTFQNGNIPPGTDWYAKQEKLGKGHFGNVYKCKIKERNELFALKIIKENIEKDDIKKIIDIEKKLQEKSLKHENLIQYYGLVSSENSLNIFMEFASDGSLADLYTRNGCPFIDQQVSLYSKQILHGLQYLHQHKIMHRDIKCENVVLANINLAKLCDFGLAGIMRNEARYLSTKCGTEKFQAPEVLVGKQYTYSADIWSFGATVLEMKLAGQPNQIDDRLECSDPLQSYENKNFSPYVMQLLRRCLVTDYHKRASIPDLLQEPLCSLSSKLSENEINALIEDTRECCEIVKNFKSYFQIWTKTRENLISFLESSAKELDKSKDLSNTGSAAGSSICIVGGVLSAAGLAAIPATAGASSILTVIGTLIGSGGSVISIATTINELLSNNSKLKEMNEECAKEKTELYDMIQILDQLRQKLLEANILNRLMFFFQRLYIELNPQISNSETKTNPLLNQKLKVIDDYLNYTAKIGFTVIAGCLDELIELIVLKKTYVVMKGVLIKGAEGTFVAGIARTKTVTTTTTNVSKFVKGASAFAAVLNVGFIGLDIYTLVKSVTDKKNGSLSELGMRFREFGNNMSEGMLEIKEVHDNLSRGLASLNISSESEEPTFIQDLPDEGSNTFESFIQAIEQNRSGMGRFRN